MTPTKYCYYYYNYYCIALVAENELLARDKEHIVLRETIVA
jgi:hypothetical protein